jgi:hypothetical protein
MPFFSWVVKIATRGILEQARPDYQLYFKERFSETLKLHQVQNNTESFRYCFVMVNAKYKIEVT